MLRRKERRTIAAVFAFLAVGIFLAILWFGMMETLAARDDTGYEDLDDLGRMFLAFGNIIGAVAFLFIVIALLLIVQWAYLRRMRDRQSRKVLVPRRRR